MLKIGDIIRIRREELGFSQEEVAFGICSVSTLSKIENGQQAPHRSVFEAVMECIGLSPERYPSFLSEQELELYNLKHDIRNCLYHDHIDRAKELLSRFVEMAPMHTQNTQFIEYVKAVFLRLDSNDMEKAYIAFEKALAITGKKFMDAPVRKLLLNFLEVDILYYISICFSHINRLGEALSITTKLIAYIESRFLEPYGKAQLLAMLYFAHSNQTGLAEHHEDSMKSSLKCIELCRNYGILKTYPFALFNYGYAMIELGMPDGVRFIQWAYHLFESLDVEDNLRIIREYAKNRKIDL